MSIKTFFSFINLKLLLSLLIFSCNTQDNNQSSNKNGEKKMADSLVVEKILDYESLTKSIIIVDGHVDLPYRFQKEFFNSKSIVSDLSTSLDTGDFDFVRAKAGGLNAPFMSIYVPASFQKTGGGKQYADQLIDLVDYIIKKNEGLVARANSPKEVQDNFRKGMLSFPLGIENGAAIEDDINNVDYFQKKGVRYITLTHSKDNLICDSSYDKTRTHKGLSDFGEKVVERMNQVGIMIDVSHISDDTFYDVMTLSKAPVIASHSSCRHFTPDFERNMSDDMLKLLAKNNGVIMINFGSKFLSKKVADNYAVLGSEIKELIKEKGLDKDADKNEIAQLRKEVEKKKLFANVKIVADHIDHVVELVGIDHVGLGSDFEGVGDTLPEQLKDVSQYPNLIKELIDRGYSKEDIEKVCSGNVFRVWNAVEEYANGL